MAEVKKSYFVAIDSDKAAGTGAGEVGEAVTGGTFENAFPGDAAVTDNRTAFLIEPSGLPDMSLDFEEVTRDVIRNSYLPASPMRGIINTSSSMTVELHGGGLTTTGLALRKPDYHPALNSAFGGHKYRAVEAAATVDLVTGAWNVPADVYVGAAVDGISPTGDPGDVQVFKGDATGYIVVQYTGTGTGVSTGVIMGKVGTWASTTPTWKARPQSAYWMPNTVSDIPKFAFAYYRANIVREIYAKLGCTSCEFPFKAGELILPAFNFNVADGDVEAFSYTTDTTATDRVFKSAETTLSSSVAGPLFAKSVGWTFKVLDTQASAATLWSSAVDLTDETSPTARQKIVDAFTLRLTNEQNSQKDITAAQGIFGYAISNRNVELTLSAYYDNDTVNFATENLSKLFNDATNRYRLSVSAFAGSVDGNRFFIFAPRLGFKTKVTEENGLFKYDVTGTAEKCPTFLENALSCVFF